jgi:DNA transformation protein and related proteins
MSASKEFIEYIMELLEPIAAIEGSKFFGGYGIKSDSIQFAMIMGNSLYFVVNDKTRPKYAKLNKQPFSYTTKNGKRLVKRYFEVPEDLLEEQDALLEWARESIAVAKATSNKK